VGHELTAVILTETNYFFPKINTINISSHHYNFLDKELLVEMQLMLRVARVGNFGIDQKFHTTFSA